jgi:hypothetical protein
MFDVTSSFSLNFDHTVENLGGGEQLCQAQNYTQGRKINLNTKGEACVLLHDI